MTFNKPKPLPSIDRLRELLDYDPETGLLTWRIGRKKAPVGREAGCRAHRGYRFVSIDYQSFLAHRLIWKLMTGRDPDEQIDHRDGDSSNNRWANLREATHADNMRNRQLKAARRLPRGVRTDARLGGFAAQIKEGGTTRYLGTFATPDEAHHCYLQAVRRLHGEFAFNRRAA